MIVTPIQAMPIVIMPMMYQAIVLLLIKVLNYHEALVAESIGLLYSDNNLI